MSARYELRSVGVFDREIGTAIAPATDPHRWFGEYLPWLGQGNVPDPMPIEQPTLTEAREAKIAAIEDLALQTRRRITGRASAQEMASWTAKLEQARAFFRGESAYPMLIAEAAARGVTVDEIAGRIQKNASDFSMAEALIAGVSGRHKDAVRAIAKVEQLQAYDVTAGWPFMPGWTPPEPPPAPKPPVLAPLDPPSL